MKITKELIKDFEIEALLSFLIDYRYNEKGGAFFKSQDFKELPDFLKHFFYIVDFETEYEMSGLLTLLVNSTGRYINEINDSFMMTGNTEIASLLASVEEILIKYQLPITDKRFK